MVGPLCLNRRAQFSVVGFGLLMVASLVIIAIRCGGAATMRFGFAVQRV